MPRQVFTAGEILTAANMNDLSDQTVMVFDDSAARGSAIPTPSEGMVTYLKDTDAVEIYDGSAFGAFGGKILQVVNDSTTTASTVSATSFADTTLSATITPTSATSTIVILGQVSMRPNGSVIQAPFTVFRGGASAGTNLGNAAEGLGRVSSEATYHSVGIAVSDSPSTTSATTYNYAVRRINGTSVSTSPDGQKSTMTLIEVAG
jgi:hypothetical protein